MTPRLDFYLSEAGKAVAPADPKYIFPNAPLKKAANLRPLGPMVAEELKRAVPLLASYIH